jgi:hypothetical protein
MSLDAAVIMKSYPAFILNRRDGRLYMRVEKSHRDLSKLARKVIIDKNGHKKTVYVRPGLPVKKESMAGKESWYLHQLTHDELKVFVKESRTGKTNDKAFIGAVTPAAAQRIEAVCGKKVVKIMLESGAIRHSYSKEYHLLEKDDIFHYVDVVNTATDIQLSDKKHLNNDVITLRKDINGQILFAVEVRVNHGGWLSLVTCYRLHKKR